MTAGNLSDINIKSRAAAWAIGIHLVLLLLFIFLRYTLPPPEPLREMGIEVNLGTDPDGSGDDQPMAIDDPAAERAQQRYRTASAHQPDGLPDMERSDDPDAPEVGPVSNRNNRQQNTAAQQDRRRQTNRREQQTSNQTQPQRPRYVYSGSTGAGGNRAAADHAGSSEGNTTGSGDRGVPGGTPGAENYEGSPGNGSGGISHSLRGRTISPARFEAEFREGGKVVVQVTVDRDGNILDAKVKSAPNAELRRIALQKIKQARFSKTTSGEPQAFGEVTIIFKARS